MTRTYGDLTRREKIIHRTTTGLVLAVMMFSIVNFVFNDHFPFPNGPEGAFAHLGLPEYFKIELTTAKILGVLALVIPAVPVKIEGIRVLRVRHHVDFGEHRPLRARRREAQRGVRPRPAGLSGSAGHFVCLFRKEPFPRRGRALVKIGVTTRRAVPSYQAGEDDKPNGRGNLDTFEAHRPLLVAHAVSHARRSRARGRHRAGRVAAVERPARRGRVSARLSHHPRDAPVLQRARFGAGAA